MTLNQKQSAALLAVSTARKLSRPAAQAAGVHHTVLRKITNDGLAIVTGDAKLGPVHSLTDAGKAVVSVLKKEAAKAAKLAAKATPTA